MPDTAAFPLLFGFRTGVLLPFRSHLLCMIHICILDFRSGLLYYLLGAWFDFLLVCVATSSNSLPCSFCLPFFSIPQFSVKNRFLPPGSVRFMREKDHDRRARIVKQTESAAKKACENHRRLRSIRAGTSGKFTAYYTQSLSSNGSPHSGQNFGGCAGSAGCQPHLSQR